MNKLEQDTLEVIQEFLPRIAVALEEIAKELKNQNKLNDVGNSNSAKSDTRRIDRLDAYKMLRKAGIPVELDSDEEVMLGNDLLIGKLIAYLSPTRTENNAIMTLSAPSVLSRDLTVAHIQNFITEYKTLEKEIFK